MIYSTRLKKILQYCLYHRDEYVSLDDLADLLKISRRTIFRELKNIDQDLEVYDLKLVNQSGKGVCLKGSKEKKDELLKEVQMEGIDYINKEERQQLLMFELLRSASISKLVHYANMFQVSEATISNDLDSMEPWFTKHHLQLTRKPGIGVEVSGAEQDMRFAMTKLLHETLQSNSKYGDVNYLDSSTLLHEIFINDEHNSIMRLLNQDILERILDVFHTYQHELSLDRYAQASYIGLMIHLVIAVDRILKHEEIADNEQVLVMIQDDVSFLQAEKMAQYLEMEFDIDIPKTEIAFIALHIKGAKSTAPEQENDRLEVTRIQELIGKLLNSYDDSMRAVLLQDEELIQGLTTHLEPTIIRLRNNLPIYNPLLSQIKEMYSDLFQQTKKACLCIEEEYECSVSEDEAGFITMHIGASLERAKQLPKRMRDVHIGVVCASGIGVSALLCARIAKAFPYGVHVHTKSMEEIHRNEIQDSELLVSTFPLENIKIKTFCVSPLLSSEDIGKLKKALEELWKVDIPQPIRKEEDFAKNVADIKVLCSNIQEVLQNIYSSVIDAKMTREELIPLIAKTHSRNEHQEKQIVEALWQREKMGSVILSEEGFAMLHTRCDGVKHSVLHLYYPKEETFQTKEFKGLSFLIVLLDKKEDTYKAKLLSAVSRGLIEQPSFCEAIKKRDEAVIHEQIAGIMKEVLVEVLEDIL